MENQTNNPPNNQKENQTIRKGKNNKSNNIITSFLQAGYSMVPIKKGTKGTIPSEVNYEDYTKKQPTPEEVKVWLEAGYGLSLVLGFNGLVLIDFDNKELFKEISIKKVNTTIIKSPKRGGHLLYQGEAGEILKYYKENKVVIEIKNSGTTPLINKGYELLNSFIPERIDFWEELIKKLMEKAGFDVLIPEYHKKYSIQDILRGASEGKRNNFLFGLVQFCNLSGSNQEETEVIAYKWNKKLVKPLPSKEVKATLARSENKRYRLLFQENPKKYKINSELGLEEKYEVPPGWDVDERGISKIKYNKNGEEELIPISSSYMKISGRGYNIDTNEVFLKLFWKDLKERNHEDFFPQRELYTRRDLLKNLSTVGIDVTDNNTKPVVDFLAKSASYNYRVIEEYIISQKQGWKDAGFVLGDKLYDKEKTKNIYLLAQNDRLKGVKQKGTVEGWLKAAEKLLEYPRARFKIYAACTAPLLKLLDARSFWLHDYGDTSVGKTITSELAISIYGSPYILELTANATKVGIERMAASFCDLPLFLDETSLVDQKILQSLIYMLANETGRIRGSIKPGSLQKTEHWKTVILSTGETSVKTENSFGGANVRVIEMYGGLVEKDFEAVEKYKDNINENYGVIAPLLINKLLNYSKEDILKTFKELKSKFKSGLKRRIEVRLANTFAAIATGGFLFEEIMADYGFDKNTNPEKILKTVIDIYEETRSDLEGSSYIERFLVNLKGWVVANSQNFISLDILDSEDEKTSWSENLGQITEDYVDIFPHILKKQIELWNFDYKRVLKDLKEKKITKCSHGRQYQTTIKGTKNVSVIRFYKNKLFSGEDRNE